MGSLGTWVVELRSRLSGVSETPGLDGQVLLAQVTGKSRAWILAHPEARLTSEQSRILKSKLARLLAGEPLPYVLGHWEFFGLEFEVSPEVLIPRPETELLVEYAIRWSNAHPDRHGVVDVGTGTGCIAISLLKHCPDLNVDAVDISLSALALARRNARLHAIENHISFIQADFLEPFKDQVFDLICANPPYIPSAELDRLPVAQHEPRLALDGGLDGQKALRCLLTQATVVLAPGGLLLSEIEASQGQAAFNMAQQAFPNAQIDIIPDLSGRDRLISIQRD